MSEVIEKLIVEGRHCRKSYEHCKVHNFEYLIRPVVSMITTPVHQLTKLLHNLIALYTKPLLSFFLANLEIEMSRKYNLLKPQLFLRNLVVFWGILDCTDTVVFF